MKRLPTPSKRATVSHCLSASYTCQQLIYCVLSTDSAGVSSGDLAALGVPSLSKGPRMNPPEVSRHDGCNDDSDSDEEETSSGYRRVPKGERTQRPTNHTLVTPSGDETPDPAITENPFDGDNLPEDEIQPCPSVNFDELAAWCEKRDHNKLTPGNEAKMREFYEHCYKNQYEYWCNPDGATGASIFTDDEDNTISTVPAPLTTPTTASSARKTTTASSASKTSATNTTRKYLEGNRPLGPPKQQVESTHQRGSSSTRVTRKEAARVDGETTAEFVARAMKGVNQQKKKSSKVVVSDSESESEPDYDSDASENDGGEWSETNELENMTDKHRVTVREKTEASKPTRFRLRGTIKKNSTDKQYRDEFTSNTHMAHEDRLKPRRNEIHSSVEHIVQTLPRDMYVALEPHNTGTGYRLIIDNEFESKDQVPRLVQKCRFVSHTGVTMLSFTVTLKINHYILEDEDPCIFEVDKIITFILDEKQYTAKFDMDYIITLDFQVSPTTQSNATIPLTIKHKLIALLFESSCMTKTTFMPVGMTNRGRKADIFNRHGNEATSYLNILTQALHCVKNTIKTKHLAFDGLQLEHCAHAIKAGISGTDIVHRLTQAYNGFALFLLACINHEVIKNTADNISTLTSLVYCAGIICNRHIDPFDLPAIRHKFSRAATNTLTWETMHSFVDKDKAQAISNICLDPTGDLLLESASIEDTDLFCAFFFAFCAMSHISKTQLVSWLDRSSEKYQWLETGVVVTANSLGKVISEQDKDLLAAAEDEAHLKLELRAAQDDLRAAQDDLTREQYEHDVTQKKLDAAKKTITELEAKLATAEHERDDARKELAQAQQDRDTALQQLAQVTARAEAAEARVSQLEAANTELSAKIAGLQETVAQLKHKVEIFAELNKQNETASCVAINNDVCDEELERLTQILNYSRATVIASVEDLARAEDNLASAQDSQQIVQDNLDDARDAVQESQVELRAATDTAETTSAMVTRKSSRVAKFTAEAQEYMKNLEKAKSARKRKNLPLTPDESGNKRLRNLRTRTAIA